MSILDKASLIQIPSGYKSTKLYSLRPTNGDGDFTFARASSATRVNSEGLIETAQVVSTTELVTNGDFATDSDWTKGSGWSISGGKATKSGTDLAYLTQSSLISVIGKTYRVKASITNVTTGNIRIDNFTSGTTYTSNIEIDITYTATSAGVFRFLGWGGFDGSIDNVSVKEVFENDVPRLDYSDGSCACLLLEPQRTNLVTYSEDFSQWNAINNVIVTDNFTTSPDGTQNASKLVFDGTTIGRIELSVSASGTNTQSVYLKTESGTQNVSIGAGTADLTEFTITNQWVRYSHTGGGTYPRILCNDAATIYVYGAQFEQGSYATSYIPTSGSTVTRTADVCNNAGTAATFNSTEGVLFAEIAALNDSTSTSVYSISDGTNANTLYVGFSSTSNTIQAQLVVGGVAQTNMNYVVTDRTQYNKVAVLYENNNHKMYINGIEAAVDTSGSVPSADTFDRVNFDLGQGSFDFYGKTKQLMYFDEALSDEELSDLTGQVNLSFNNLATFYNYTIL